LRRALLRPRHFVHPHFLFKLRAELPRHRPSPTHPATYIGSEFR
jgi:hypothetical protein